VVQDAEAASLDEPGKFVWIVIVEPTDSNTDKFFDRLHSDDVDFSDVRVQEFAKRALVTAASGGHRVLLF
jgi:predicted ATPase with chaperone activity